MAIFKNNGIIYQKTNIDDDTKDNKTMLNGTYDSTYVNSLGNLQVTKREFFNFENPSKPYTVSRHPRAGMVKSRLYIRLTNSYFSSIGYFDSFDVVEAADKPFNLSYSVSFKAEHTTWSSVAQGV